MNHDYNCEVKHASTSILSKFYNLFINDDFTHFHRINQYKNLYNNFTKPAKSLRGCQLKHEIMRLSACS